MEADWGYFTNAKINTSGDKMSAEKHWERAYAILLEASNKKIAELEEKLAIAIEALEFYADGDNWGHIDPYKNDYRIIDKTDIGKGDFQISENVDDNYVGGLKAREALEEIK